MPIDQSLLDKLYEKGSISGDFYNQYAPLAKGTSEVKDPEQEYATQLQAEKARLQASSISDIGLPMFAEKDVEKEAAANVLNRMFEYKKQKETEQEQRQIDVEAQKQMEAQALQEENTKRQYLGLPMVGNIEQLKAERQASQGLIPSAEASVLDRFKIAGEEKPEVQAPTQYQIPGYGLMQKGLMQQAKGAMDLAKAEGDVYKTYLDENAKIQKAEAGARAEEQTRIDQHMARYQDIVDQIANKKIDPNRLYSNMSTGNKILAGIGLLLGSFGGSRGNTAVAAMNEAIDKDIKSQVADMESLSQKAAGYRNVYGMMLDRMQNKTAAFNAAKAALVDNTKMMLSQKMAQAKSPEAQGKLNYALGELEIQKQTYLAKVSDALRGSESLQYADEATRKILDLKRTNPDIAKSAEEQLGGWQKLQETYKVIDEVLPKLYEAKTYGALVDPRKRHEVKILEARVIQAMKASARNERMNEMNFEKNIEPFLLETFGKNKEGLNATIRALKKHAKLNAPPTYLVDSVMGRPQETEVEFTTRREAK